MNIQKRQLDSTTPSLPSSAQTTTPAILGFVAQFGGRPTSGWQKWQLPGHYSHGCSWFATGNRVVPGIDDCFIEPESETSSEFQSCVILKPVAGSAFHRCESLRGGTSNLSRCSPQPLFVQQRCYALKSKRVLF
jgi:hypothetical protein